MNISEINKHLYPFKILAVKFNDSKNFIKAARKIKNVPSEVSKHFREKYRDGVDLEKACQKFIDETIESMYLDYFNNFLTVERFAEYYDITKTNAERIIKVGRKINHAWSKSKS